MKNLFIPYELAVIAKEKGFNEPCLAHYVERSIRENKNIRLCYSATDRDNFDEVLCIAPLYQQIVDWFREEHQIRICHIHIGKMTGETFAVVKGGELVKNIDKEIYYKALNEAIEEAFKLI